MLSGMRVKMEQFFQDNRTYAGACTAGTVVPPPAATSNFSFACSDLGAAAYTVTATGLGSMAEFKYSINQSNTRVTVGLPSGWNNANAATCWILKKDGSC